MNLKNNYEKLKKKFSLPDFSQLNREFKIEDIDAETRIMLVRIRKKMTEKIESHGKLIESILQPDSNLSNLYETHHLSDKDRKEAYILFKKIMSLVRKSNYVDIDNNQKETAEFIRTAYDEWKSMKETLQGQINRLIKNWEKETDMESDLSYFG